MDQDEAPMLAHSEKQDATATWKTIRHHPLTTLRYFALDGTDHTSHKEQGSTIRRYIIWRNKHAADERLREVINKANIA